MTKAHNGIHRGNEIPEPVEVDGAVYPFDPQRFFNGHRNTVQRAAKFPLLCFEVTFCGSSQRFFFENDNECIQFRIMLPDLCKVFTDNFSAGRFSAPDKGCEFCGRSVNEFSHA